MKLVEARIPMAYIYDDGRIEENPFASAAAYLSWIAYPGESRTAKSAKFVEAVRAIPYKDDKNRKHAPHDLQGLKKERIDGAIRDAMILIERRRIPAIWMAGKRLGMDERWPSGMSVLGAAKLLADPDATIDESAGAILDDGEIQNITARVWYETLPAMAMLLAMPIPRNRAFDLILNPSWIEESIERAERIAPEIGRILNIKTLFIPKLCAIRLKPPVS